MTSAPYYYHYQPNMAQTAQSYHHSYQPQTQSRYTPTTNTAYSYNAPVPVRMVPSAAYGSGTQAMYDSPYCAQGTATTMSPYYNYQGVGSTAGYYRNSAPNMVGPTAGLYEWSPISYDNSLYGAGVSALTSAGTCGTIGMAVSGAISGMNYLRNSG
jgi:hypothetical protein